MTSLGLFKFAGISGWGEIEADDSEISGVGTVTGDFCSASDDFEGNVDSFSSQLYGQNMIMSAAPADYDQTGVYTQLPTPRDFTEPTATLSGDFVLCVAASGGNQQWNFDGCLAEWKNTSGAWLVYYPDTATGIGTSEFYLVIPYKSDPVNDDQPMTLFQGLNTPATTPSTYFSAELGIAVTDDAFYTTP